jgi:hypothetical protein
METNLLSASLDPALVRIMGVEGDVGDSGPFGVFEHTVDVVGVR